MRDEAARLARLTAFFRLQINSLRLTACCELTEVLLDTSSAYGRGGNVKRNAATPKREQFAASPVEEFQGLYCVSFSAVST
jgi:hypothetical protein